MGDHRTTGSRVSERIGASHRHSVIDVRVRPAASAEPLRHTEMSFARRRGAGWSGVACG